MPYASLAIDLGAESGRAIVGVLDQGQLTLTELHRFRHEPVSLPTGLHWDITGIWREIVVGLRAAAAWSQEQQIKINSIGVDTWGVDWALLDTAGELIGLPHAYRDPRNQAAFEQAVKRLGVDKLYQTTGIQLLPFNSLYSLYAHSLPFGQSLTVADRLLFLPDLLHYWLSGTQAIEATIASTSQMVDAKTGGWATDLIESLGLPTRLLTPTVPAGTKLGKLRHELAAELGLSADIEIVTPGSHDTASAIISTPADDNTSWCYLSSGTWSLLGAELAEPCLSPAAQAAMFTNELGVGDTVRFLKNIAGLWLVQECRRDFQRQGSLFDYAELTTQAEAAEPFRTLIDPSRAEFIAPGNMCQKISRFAEETGQPVPTTPGEFVRACLESLALAYGETLAELEVVLEQSFDVLHIIGGGGQNRLLNQMTADATDQRVVVGPYEATAVGNLLTQAMAMDQVASVAELRQVVAHSFDVEVYQPNGNAAWQHAKQRYRKLQNTILSAEEETA